MSFFSQLSRKSVLCAGALVMLCSYSFAGTIVSVTDGAEGGRAALFLGGQLGNVVALPWTQGASFSNVIISANLMSRDPDFRKGTAFLMDAIGTGTTVASEVVPPVDFIAPADGRDNPPLTVLFTGLNLGPGTYYLVLTAPTRIEDAGSPLVWQLAAGGRGVTAPSVTLGNIVLAGNFNSSGLDPFPPASSFVPFDPQERLIFDVTSVPEPKTSMLFLISLAALILYKSCGMGRAALR